ncbi:MAG TPA: ATP-binding protein [Acidimicrobiia bacterium]|nr:ATP-binding protein [Acidimicrobiia bacterium]
MPRSAPLDRNLSGSLEQRFPPESRSASEARAFVLAAGWSDDAETNLRLATVVSEVVTNAILHARTAFLVTVILKAETIRVAVRDNSAALPVRREYQNLEPTGRGLHIVDALADRWGVEEEPGGKTVWFELERENAA